MKKVIVTGATGLIGKKLVSALIERNDEVVIFSRDIKKVRLIFPSIKEVIEWDYQKPELWNSNLENSDAVVHLAGSNLFAKRWNDEFKKSIIESSKVSRKNLIDTIKL